MIQFYNRQANSNGSIGANPRHVIETMKEAGLESLTENQIKSWWSTYHQKRKRAMQAVAADVERLARS